MFTILALQLRNNEKMHESNLLLCLWDNGNDVSSSVEREAATLHLQILRSNAPGVLYIYIGIYVN